MNLRVEVTSAAKKAQALGRRAAAVSVLTSEDIRRSGATNIPEVLRLVPGVQVARVDASNWAISARGFNSTLRQQAAGADRRPQRLYAAVLRRVLGRAGHAAGGHRAHRGDPRSGRHAVGRQRRQRRHQHHHQAGRATRRARCVAGGRRQRGARLPRVRYGGSSASDASLARLRQVSRRAQTPDPQPARMAHDDWRRRQAGFRADWTLERRRLTSRATSTAVGWAKRRRCSSRRPPSLQTVSGSATRLLQRFVNLSGSWTRKLSSPRRGVVGSRPITID